jgi:AbrB family looped-hinge helix DNA binding protein
MNAIVEIDKAGRIVVPKKMRDALHLKPGTQLTVERRGDNLILMPNSNEAQLVIENGIPLVIPANHLNNPILTNSLVNELIAQGRRERDMRALGSDADDAGENR